MFIGSLYPPRIIHAAAGVTPDVLRQWMTGHSSLAAALAFIGETGAGGRRRYSLGGAALVWLAARLSGAGERGPGITRASEAIEICNALAPFIQELEREYSTHGAEALAAMGAAGPVAIVTPGDSWPASGRFKVETYSTGAAYAARPAIQRHSFGLHIAMAEVFSATATELTRAAWARIQEDEE